MNRLDWTANLGVILMVIAVVIALKCCCDPNGMP